MADPLALVASPWLQLHSVRCLSLGPLYAQPSTTDRRTRCETDSSDVTTCNTQPNYNEELRRTEQDKLARQDADQRFWRRIDQQREQGNKLHEVPSLRSESRIVV